MEISKFFSEKNITVKMYIINSLTKSSQNFDNLCQFQILPVLIQKLDIKNLEKISKKLAYSSLL
jgi:hypothetical protein